MFDEVETYYIRVRGRIQGPFAIEQLKTMRQRGQFSRAHEVSTDRLNWQSASVLDSVFSVPKRASRQNTQADVAERPVGGLDEQDGVLALLEQDSNTKSIWHYTVGLEQHGPVSLLELRMLLASGNVQRTDLAWKDGMADWTAIANLEELSPVDPPSLRTTVIAPKSTSPNSHNYAGFWFRFFATLIDGLVITTASAVITSIVGVILAVSFGISLKLLPDRESEAAAASLAIILNWFILLFSNFMVHWLYFAFMESSAQRATVGKLACGIVVIDESGVPLTFAQATGRHFAKVFITSATLGVGFLMCVWTQKQQCIHDKIANCVVVKR